MCVIWTERGFFHKANYFSEAAILQVQRELFGIYRIYLPVKRRIGAKEGVRNIAAN